tara:strand:+ start:2250 stop:3131 length:882 start_codon:yes stop_codon:yes gene_type:complete
MPIRTPLNVQPSSSYSLAPSSIEDIDFAVYKYVDERLNISVDTNEGWQKVPVIYSLPERAYQIKNNPDLRPNGRTLKYPLISIHKVSAVQNPANKGIYGVNIPPFFDYYDRGGAIPITRVVEQESTAKFANANAIRKSDGGQNINRQTFPGVNKNVVYETLFIPFPTFVEMTYTIDIVTEYQTQMNQILSKFHTHTGDPSVFSVEHENNSYEAFLDSNYNINFKADGLDVTERIFTAALSLKVLGYLVGDKDNQNTPIKVKRQSAAKVRFSRERSMLDEEPDFNANRKDKYRP